MHVALRRFVEADLPSLDLWREGISADRYMEKLAPAAFESAGFAGWGTEFVWYVISADGLDLGCVWIESKKNQRNVGILGIVIGRPDFLGKGLGRNAVRKAVIQGRLFLGYDIVRLHVRQLNERAIACYASCGFVITGEGAKSVEAVGKVPFYRMELFLDEPSTLNPQPVACSRTGS
jgi:RimJ/RimL family protein N-acetyltransferase